jgi:hypothetical protein
MAVRVARIICHGEKRSVEIRVERSDQEVQKRRLTKSSVHTPETQERRWSGITASNAPYPENYDEEDLNTRVMMGEITD